MEGIATVPRSLPPRSLALPARLFSAASLVHLGILSQVGLVLFMFLVGLEFDPKLLRGRGEAALLTSSKILETKLAAEEKKALVVFLRQL